VEFTELNEAQRRAVTAGFGHLRINAGAGTGKTKTLASRALWLQDQAGPGQMLALTFSVAARTNLMARLDAMILARRRGSPIPTLTFHGLAHRAVRLAIQSKESRFRPHFAVENAETIWQRYGDSLLRGLPSSLDPGIRSTAYRKAIDMLRQQGAISPEQLRPGLKPLPVSVAPGVNLRVSLDEVRRVWERYEALLVRENTLDYPGFLSEANRIFAQGESEALARLRRGLKWILVDEFQDTSRAMFSLLLVLAGQQAALNVVGDSDQTIYGFNGSEVSNLTEFEQRVAATGLPVLPPIDLTENYRSAEPILTVANQILAAGGVQGKRLVTAPAPLGTVVDQFRSANHPVTLVRAPSISLAADYVAKEIRRLVQEERVAPGEIAVLVRKNTLFSPQGEEVKAALEQEGLTVTAQAPNAEAGPDQATIDAALERICGLRALAAKPVTEVLALLQAGHYDTFLEGAPASAVAARLTEAMSAGAETPSDVPDFLADEAMAEESGVAPTVDPGAVQIRTVHSVKGEEFRVVFLLYLGDMQFPHGPMPDVAEERRLLYVGVTRAQERLYILGKNGTRGEDFFTLCQAPGVRRIAWTVFGGPAAVEEVEEESFEWDLSEAERAELAALADDDE
jgi:DNA helicase-2/ATP-dependent DNA helicase PcrA